MMWVVFRLADIGKSSRIGRPDKLRVGSKERVFVQIDDYFALCPLNQRITLQERLFVTARDVQGKLSVRRLRFDILVRPGVQKRETSCESNKSEGPIHRVAPFYRSFGNGSNFFQLRGNESSECTAFLIRRGLQIAKHFFLIFTGSILTELELRLHPCDRDSKTNDRLQHPGDFLFR